MNAACGARARVVRSARNGVLALALGLLSPSGARALELERALAAIHASHPQLLAARAALSSVEENLPQARAGFLPSIGASGAAGLSDFENSIDDGTRETAEIALTIDQNLFDGFGTTASIARAKALIESQNFDYAQTESSVFFDAISAHASVHRDQQTLEHARANVESLEEQLEAVHARLSVGEATRTDLDQAEARLIGARAELDAAENRLASSSADYADAVGEPPASDLERAEPPIALLPATLEEAVAAAENAFVVRRAEADERAADAAVGVARSALLPSVDLVGALSYEDEPSTTVDWERDATVEVRVDVPLFQRGAAHSRLRQSRRDAEQRRFALEDARRDVRRAATQAWSAYRTARRTLTRFERQAEINRRALDGVLTEESVGARLVIDVLDAEEELFRSQIAVERARADELVAAYRLLADIGRLTAGALGLAVGGEAGDRAAAAGE